MSTLYLAAPEQSAHTNDWLAWLQELTSMPQSVEVRKALRHAKSVVSARRHKQQRHMREVSPFGRRAIPA